MFGIGYMELVILMVIGAIIVGFVVLIVTLAAKGRNGAAPHEAYTQLLEENRRLREELAARERKS